MRIIELDQTVVDASTVDGQQAYRMPDDFWGLISVTCRGKKLIRIEDFPQKEIKGEPTQYWPGDPDHIPCIWLYPVPLGNGQNDLTIVYERKPPEETEA